MAVGTSADGLSPGTKFDPTADGLNTCFLLPHIQGKKLSLDGVILETNPLSATAHRGIVSRDHGRKGNEVFFFTIMQGQEWQGPSTKAYRSGWCASRGRVYVDGKRLRDPRQRQEIGWRKYLLNFRADGERGKTGWVMHEYSITSLADLAALPTRLYHIRFSVYVR
ncbi:hypothetical protein GUJ93_ZPchr0007g3625 [Zizania palustris]|uniref:NAC domain-containing protein n=1 Tax=Zizania palustris TaxID=103762 RepID=A0A8J5VUA3_ZIZPA|nr:hypothetical protein GUJ93_ZPchr0007g3625 [Zizania palustris]